ncbi:unnamed protein product [Peniophora sp. CBMAI 1063]|nr:unnamed protein product [Peniophora sp. CBMAI 1063]
MQSKLTKKRPNPSPTDDEPTKKKANGRMGRPRNVGDEQYDYIMGGYPDYAALKIKQKNGQRVNISGLYNDKTIDMIAKYGWENPFRTLKQDVPDATDAARAATAAEVQEVANILAGGGVGMNEQALAVHRRKDEVVTLVRGEITKLYQRAARVEAAGGVKPAVDIPKLVKSIMAKPTQRQLYVVWAKMKERPDLEAEVSRRYAAEAKEKGGDATSRGAVWNSVAAEWFNSSTIEEKEHTRQEATKLLQIEMKRWEDNAASAPSTPEEAHEFMQGSEEFLRAMMQFFANRASGYAVMFLVGPDEVSLSEAVCDIPGQPKVLYSQVAEEETTLRLIGGRILTQSRLINELKWGPQRGYSDSPMASGDATGPTSEGIQLDSELREVERQTDESRGQNHSSVSRSESSRSKEQLDTSASMTSFAEPAAQAARMRPERMTGGVMDCLLPQDGEASYVEEKTVEAAAKLQAAQARILAAEAEILAAKAEAEAAKAEAAKAEAAKAEAGKSSADVEPGHAPASPVEPVQMAFEDGFPTYIEPSVSSPTPVPTSVAPSMHRVSVLTFDPHASVRNLDGIESAYPTELNKALLAIGPRKVWWENTNSSKFFQAVPKQMRQGGVDVAIGCELSLAYLALEQSTATENKLMMHLNDSRNAYLPEYMASFSDRSWAARWHKRALPGTARTRAALDSDVHITLPRQWAMLQPAVRLDSEQRISQPALASMAWSPDFAPGESGIRVLVVTLLNWGSHAAGKQDEQKEWRAVAADVAAVLRILAEKTGESAMSEPEGRKKYVIRQRNSYDHPLSTSR